MATWRKLITKTMVCVGESWGDVVDSTLTDAQLDKDFDDGYGGSCGHPFTLWTVHRVYFPVVYDGAEWVGSVPRNPCDEKTRHVGGE